MGTEAASAPPIHERERHIADLMARNEYRTHTTVQELAEKWGLSVHTVQKDAGAAARRFRAISTEEAEVLRGRLAATFEHIASDALRSLNAVTQLPDYKAAIEALRNLAEFSGAGVDPTTNAPATPKKITIVYGDDEPQDRPEQVPGADPGTQGVQTG